MHVTLFLIEAKSDVCFLNVKFFQRKDVLRVSLDVLAHFLKFALLFSMVIRKYSSGLYEELIYKIHGLQFQKT